MANIIIDPVIVTTPADNAGRAEVEAWLENLTIWLNEALTAPFTWQHYLQASQLLEANGHFPSFEQLRRLQQKYRLDINIRQIARSVDDFFRDDKHDLYNHLKHLDYAIEFESGSITITPEHFIARLPEYIHDDLRTLVAECCACKHIDHPFGQELNIATLALPDGSREIAVSVVVLYALPDFARPADNKIAQTLPLLITPEDLLPLTDVLDLWAKGEQGIIYAINQQYKKDWSGTATSSFKFQLGPRFIESVKERGLGTNETMLRIIVRAASSVIAGRAKDIPSCELHPFRKSETADSPQLIRDSDHARAWRLMLQKRGAGWRLHYWQTPGYIIEFANVCKESEREIY